MKKYKRVIRYKDDYIGKLWDSVEEVELFCDRYENILSAFNMWNNGSSLKEIEDKCNIFCDIYSNGETSKSYLPKHLYNVKKENHAFKIPFWQCCDKPVYKIHRFFCNGLQSTLVNVGGVDDNDSYYGEILNINSSRLKDLVMEVENE